MEEKDGRLKEGGEGNKGRDKRRKERRKEGGAV